MNYSTLSSLVSDDVTFISCSFVEVKAPTPDYYGKTKADTIRELSGQTEVKTYTYKTVLKNLKEGDLVAIQATARDKPFGVHIVKVLATDVQVDYSNNNIEYKWAFQKIDTEILESIVQAELELVQKVNKLEGDSRKKQVLNGLKEQGISIESLEIKLLS